MSDARARWMDPVHVSVPVCVCVRARRGLMESSVTSLMPTVRVVFTEFR